MPALSHKELAQKWAVACFVREGVSQQTREAFEDAFALGRVFLESYCIFPTRTYNDKSIPELVELCSREFSTTINPYYPFFLIILDERTGQDGSAVVVHSNRDEVHQMRVYPYTVPRLMGLASIGHTTVEDILLNNVPEDEPEVAEAFVYGDATPPTDAPNPFGTIHQSVRVPVGEFVRSEGPAPGFVKLRIEATKVASLGLPEVAVELVWFGEPPETVLLCCTSTTKVPEKHIAGEIR